MKRTGLLGYVTLGAFGVGAALAAGSGVSLASLQAHGARLFQREPSTEQGEVKALLKNDHDDVDGLLLTSGLRIHFPPHMGERITDVVDIGDAVEVEGHSEVTPKGEKVFEITRLMRGNKTVRIEPPQPKPGPKGPREGQPMNAADTVTDYAKNPHGEIDGLILKAGTVVKFPPHQARELKGLVAIGDKVTIEGRRHVTPEGDIHLHADQIAANGKSIKREEPKLGPKGPEHGPGEFRPGGPTNAELMRELKAIRQLLEKQVKP